MRPPVASAPAGRAGLFGRHDWSDQPRAPARARQTESKYVDVHGYPYVGDLMDDLNPLTGHLHVEALHMTRVAREAAC